MTQPLMPKATAVWLIENTTLTFDQVAAFCGLHPLEVQSIADGETAPGMIGFNQVVASTSSMPSLRSSSAMAPKIVCAFFSRSLSSIIIVRTSGRRSKRFFGAICPSMTQCRIPRRVNTSIAFPSWPTLSQVISSTSGASSGLVSFSKATATSERTPMCRACRAKIIGSERFPAMIPRLWMVSLTRWL